MKLVDTYYLIRPWELPSEVKDLTITRWQVRGLLKKRDLRNCLRKLIFNSIPVKTLLREQNHPSNIYRKIHYPLCDEVPWCDLAINILKECKRCDEKQWKDFIRHYLLASPDPSRSNIEWLIDHTIRAIQRMLGNKLEVINVMGIKSKRRKEIVRRLERYFCIPRNCNHRLDPEDLTLFLIAFYNDLDFLPAPVEGDCANCLWKNRKRVKKLI